jgi:hypothetical protein
MEGHLFWSHDAILLIPARDKVLIMTVTNEGRRLHYP